MKLWVPLFLLFLVPLAAETIEEKKQSFSSPAGGDAGTLSASLTLFNETLDEKRFELNVLYAEGARLLQEQVAPEQFVPLITRVKAVKAEIQHIQEMWRKEVAETTQGDAYALWQQPDASIFQLVMDYGSQNYLYVIPPEIGATHLNLYSSLPIPCESWSECLELILGQYGIGIRALNPYTRELYSLKNDQATIHLITDVAEKLDLLPASTRVCYVLAPHDADPRTTVQLLTRFAHPTALAIEAIGGQVFLTGSVHHIQELLKIYTFVKAHQGNHECQVVTLNKLDAKQMETILNSAFHGGKREADGSWLQILPLDNMPTSLFLSGTREEIKKAIQLIHEVESQIENPQEKVVFWYVAKHSDAEELASVLARVYDVLIGGKSTKEEKPKEKKESTVSEAALLVKTATIQPGQPKERSHRTADGQNNFIVDPKTGAIIMVVTQDALPQIKELLKKLDVPKKMVQIEVLLFEKKMSQQNNFGLNLLRLGSEAVNKTTSGLIWNSLGGGILDFFSSRSKANGVPAYDLAYQFLIGQEDIQINASPSVTTMNQTPATIAIVEEISIDSGVNEKNKSSYNRAQYGIVMEITPTINIEETEEGEIGFILLETDITFDTTQKNPNDRPDVTRRHIKNHVRIADGQTVILGGLRRKNIEDSQESIPFLGEIPGIGKLFSYTKMHDNSTEMFVFITPKIINDPIEDAAKIRKETLAKRPGDVPEFLIATLEAKALQKRRLFEGGMHALFGRTRSVVTAAREGEYDGQ